MTSRFKTSALVLCVGALFLLAVFIVAVGRPILTSQNLAQKWNPPLVPAGTEFVGDQACAECHKQAFAPFANNGMALAMEPIAESTVLKENPKLTLQLGPYSYEIKRDGQRSFYSVTDGKDTMSVPI